MLIKKAEDIRSSEITPQEFISEPPQVSGRSSARRSRGRHRRWPARDRLAFHHGLRGKQNRRHPEKPAEHDRNRHSLQGRHQLQQLLRVLHRERRTRQTRPKIPHPPLESKDRRPGRQEAGTRRRHDYQDGPSRGAHLPPSLRRGMVDRRSLGWLLAERTDQARESHQQGQVRRVHDHPRSQANARPAGHVLQWPYVEGLRMDEAMHPLALLCFGMYGEDLPNQDGAPLRIVVPWKYGFKSAKAIVRIRFTEKQPQNTWNISAPNGVRFLFQRESAPWTIPAGVRPGSAGSANSSSAPP